MANESNLIRIAGSNDIVGVRRSWACRRAASTASVDRNMCIRVVITGLNLHRYQCKVQHRNRIASAGSTLNAYRPVRCSCTGNGARADPSSPRTLQSRPVRCSCTGNGARADPSSPRTLQSRPDVQTRREETAPEATLPEVPPNCAWTQPHRTIKCDDIDRQSQSDTGRCSTEGMGPHTHTHTPRNPQRAYPSNTWCTAQTDTNHTSALPPAAHRADKRTGRVFQCKYAAVVAMEFITIPCMANSQTPLIEECKSGCSVHARQ
jgi:hypothetical protein